MNNGIRAIVLHDTTDRITGEWITSGTVLFNAVIIDGGYSGDWVGTRVEVSEDDAAIMLSDN